MSGAALTPDPSLPVAVCARRPASGLCADAASEFWRGISPQPFLENVGGAAPLQATSVRMAWDGAHFCVLFECVDTEPWATITERDAALYTEEVVEVFIDPVGDGEAYFEIELNPLNTVMDLVLRRSRSGYRKDFAWQCEGLQTGVLLTASGWSAAFAIPFAALIAEPPRAGARWRVNFCRIDRPRGLPRELSAWSPTRSGTFHAAHRFGIVEFE